MLKKLSRYLFIFCSIFFACPVVWSALTEAEQAAVDTYRSTPAERARILERYAEAPEVLRRLRAIDSVQRDLRRTGYGRDLPTPAARHATEPQPFRFDGTGGARRTPAESRALSERYTTLVASHTASGIHSPELGAALIAGTRRRSSADSDLISEEPPPEDSPLPSTVRSPLRRSSVDESALRASRGTRRDEDLADVALRRADALLGDGVEVVDAVTPTINNPVATAAERVRDASATLRRRDVPASRLWQEARDALGASRLISTRVAGDAQRIALRERQAALARERSEPEPLRTVAVTDLPEHQVGVRDAALGRVFRARPEILDSPQFINLRRQIAEAAARRALSVDSFVTAIPPVHGRDEELPSSSTLLPPRRMAEGFSVGSTMSLTDAVAARERARTIRDSTRFLRNRTRRRRTAPAAVTPTPAPKPYVSRALPRHLFTQYTAAEMAQMRRNAKKELDAFRATLRYTRDGERKQPAGPKKRVLTPVMPEEGTIFMRVVPKTPRIVAPETKVVESSPLHVAPKPTGKNSARSIRSSASSVSFGAGSLDSGRISPADQLRRIAHQQFGHVAKPKGL